MVADTVGFVPSLRVKDNVVQAVCVAAGLPAGVGVGVAVAASSGAEWFIGAMLAALAGLILSTLVSGGVIMVLGWVRAAKKIKCPEPGGWLSPRRGLSRRPRR